tara:strand:- start:759 stop:929 length:171 start_codon:yes stop_codon:yes gene_type:complete
MIQWNGWLGRFLTTQILGELAYVSIPGVLGLYPKWVEELHPSLMEGPGCGTKARLD